MSAATATESKSRVNRRAFSAEAESAHAHQSEPRSVAEGPSSDFTSSLKRPSSFPSSSEAVGTGGIQAKLKIGQPNDRFEREADATADRILSAPAHTQAGDPPNEHSSLSAIHQSSLPSEALAKGGSPLDIQADFESNEAESIQLKLNDEPSSSLAVGRDPGRTSSLDLQADFESNEAETVQPKPLSSEALAKGDSSQTSNQINRQADQSNQSEGLTTSDSFDSQLASHSGAGSPLPSGLQGQMEGGMGADLSSVRVHTDSQAVQMSQDIGAKAFTHGSDIYFNEGQYQPETAEGQHLIAHETTHTVQQGASPVQREADPAAPAPGESPISLSFEDTAAPPPTAEDILQAEEAGKVDTGVPAEGEAAAAPPAPAPTEAGPTAGPPAGEGPQGPVEPVPEEAAEAEPKAEKQPVAAGNPEDSAQAHMNAPATQLAQQQAGIAADVTTGMQGQRQATQAKMPPLKADNTGKPEEQETEQEGILPEGKMEPISDGVTGQEPPPAKKGQHQNLGPAPDVTKNNRVLDKQKLSAFLGWFKSNFFSFSSTIKTKDPNVNTSAGERPKVPQEGKADPHRADQQKQESDEQVDKQTKEAKAAIAANPGKEIIQPQDVSEEKPMDISQEVAELSAERNQEMEDFLALGLPPDVQALTDQDMQPMLDKSLAQPRADVAAAAQKRDTETEAEITKANEETAKLNEEAARKQKETVEQNRASVAETQRKGKEDADGLMADFDTQASEKQAKAKEDIDKEVKSREKEADDELKKGEKKAGDKKKAEEDKAAAKKREMEKESKNKSWWDRAVDAVKSAVSAITSAISSIFKALREAVTAIIDAAKDLALKAIEAARKFAVAALDALGSVLKGLVNTFLGSLFPELAKKINDAIDATVNKAKEAVNAIADGLKKGVEALAEAAKAAVNKILEVFETALTAAVQIVGALVTGDFAEALKVAIKSACKIAGINPDPIFDFINRAGDTLMTILKNPVQFVKNLAKGVGGGVDLVKENIKKHLLNGMVGWRGGAMSDVPLQLPQKFDLQGIFSLVMQVLGLTYDRLRAKVVKQLGPKGEQVVGTIEKGAEIAGDVIGLLQKMYQEKSFMPLWSLIEKKWKSIKEAAMEKIRGVVALEVVKAGVKWLLSLLNPASAIVKAVIMIFDVTMFIIERKDQIVDMIKSIYGAIAPIARGDTGAASKAVENAMGRSVPVILGMLASVLGLGGIGKSVQKVLKTIQGQVDKVVDPIIKKIVDFAKRLFKGGKKGNTKLGKDAFTKKAIERAGNYIQKTPLSDSKNASTHMQKEVDKAVAKENKSLPKGNPKIKGSITNKNEIEKQGVVQIKLSGGSVAKTYKKELPNGPVPEWIKHKLTYQNTSKKKHSLYFQKKGDGFTLVRASVITEIQSYLSQVESQINSQITDNELKQHYLNILKNSKINAALAKIEKEYNKNFGTNKPPKSKGLTKGGGKNVADGMKELSLILDDLPENFNNLDDKNVHPTSNVQFKAEKTTNSPDIAGGKSKDGSGATASTLTMKPPKGITGNSTPSRSPLYKALHSEGYNVLGAHLLNHTLYGPGDSRNIVPVPSQYNSPMSSSVEEPVKKKVFGERKVMVFRIKAQWGGRAGKELKDKVPTNIQGHYAEKQFNMDNVLALAKKQSKDVTPQYLNKQKENHTNWKTDPASKVPFNIQIGSDFIRKDNSSKTKLLKTKLQVLNANLKVNPTIDWNKMGSILSISRDGKNMIPKLTNQEIKDVTKALEQEFREAQSRVVNAEFERLRNRFSEPENQLATYIQEEERVLQALSTTAEKTAENKKRKKPIRQVRAKNLRDSFVKHIETDYRKAKIAALLSSTQKSILQQLSTDIRARITQYVNGDFSNKEDSGSKTFKDFKNQINQHKSSATDLQRIRVAITANGDLSTEQRGLLNQDIDSALRSGDTMFKKWVNALDQYEDNIKTNPAAAVTWDIFYSSRVAALGDLLVARPGRYAELRKAFP